MNFARLQNIKLSYADLCNFLKLLTRELSIDGLVSIEKVDHFVNMYQNFMFNYNQWRNDQEYHSYSDFMGLYREVLFEIEDKLFELRLKTGYAF